eukprot:788388-Rhodomonas_salina.2
MPVPGYDGDLSASVSFLHPEIKSEKPQSQYILYQECGFLCSILGCIRSEQLCEIKYQTAQSPYTL